MRGALGWLTFTSYWVYIPGPIAGAVLAVGIAFILRGRGVGKSGAGVPKVSAVHRGLRVRRILKTTACWPSARRV